MLQLVKHIHSVLAQAQPTTQLSNLYSAYETHIKLSDSFTLIQTQMWPDVIYDQAQLVIMKPIEMLAPLLRL